VLLGFVVAYLLLTIAIGLWAAKRVKSTEDFAVAGRHLPLVMIVTTTFDKHSVVQSDERRALLSEGQAS
jgi:Na+/proline symporter